LLRFFVFDFKFLSVIAMKDPLRNKVKSAIKFAKEQGGL
jgi:magnesium-transporting ATPase (P-type)